MSVDVLIRRRDLIWLNLSVGPRLLCSWVCYSIFCFVGLAVYYVLRPTAFAITFTTSSILLFIGLFLAGYVVYLILTGCIQALTVNERAGVLGKHRYTLRHDGLFELTQANESLHKWSSIESVLKTKNWILVRINHYLFHIIPRRFFVSQLDSDRFADQIASHIQAETAKSD